MKKFLQIQVKTSPKRLMIISGITLMAIVIGGLFLANVQNSLMVLGVATEPVLSVCGGGAVCLPDQTCVANVCVTPAPSTSVSAVYAVYNVVSYTQGNVSNLPLIPMTGTQPAKNSCYLDQPYGLSVCRVTNSSSDVSGETLGIRTVYSRWPIENSNGQYYYVVRENGTYRTLIYRTSDNALVKTVNEFANGEWNEFRWDRSGQYPNRLYYVSGCGFYQYDFTTGQSQLIRNFANDLPGCTTLLNDVEGDSSKDSRYWTWMTTWAYDGKSNPLQSIITYDKQANQIIGKLDQAKYIQLGGKYAGVDKNGHPTFPRPNMVDMSPTGNKAVLLYGRAWGGYGTPTTWTLQSGSIYWTTVDTSGNGMGIVKEVDTNKNYLYNNGSTLGAAVTGPGTYFYDRGAKKLYVWTTDGQNPTAHGIYWEYGSRPKEVGTIFNGPHAFNKDMSIPVKVCVDETHSGWAYDYSGNEVFVCQNNRTDYLVYTNVQTGVETRILAHADLGWNNGFHFSRMSPDLKGWVLVSTYDKANTTWGSNQIFMLELKDISQHPRIWRIASTHNNYAGIYNREAYAPISMTGQTIWWGAVWAGSGSNLLDVYKVDLPIGWNNYLADIPVVSFTGSSPTANETISGTRTIGVDSSSVGGIIKAEFFINNILQISDVSAPYGFNWDTTKVSNGPYTIRVDVYSNGGKISVTREVAVNNSPKTNSVSVKLQYGRLINGVAYLGQKDTALISGAGNAGYYERGATTGFDYRYTNRVGLYWFDLSSIPQNAIISSARLILYSPKAGPHDASGSVPIFLVKTLPPNDGISWVEGSGNNYYSQYKGTSWLKKGNIVGKIPSYSWSNNLGRYSVGDLFSAYQPGKIGDLNFVKAAGAQVSTEIGSVIQDIIRSGYKYEGFAVDKNGSPSARKDGIATKEYSDINMRPALEIIYTP